MVVPACGPNCSGGWGRAAWAQEVWAAVHYASRVVCTAFCDLPGVGDHQVALSTGEPAQVRNKAGQNSAADQ